MVNIDKIKTLAKSKGISITFICGQFGKGRGYLNEIARGKNKISDENICKIARLLNTTYEYLTDATDDPSPDYAGRQAESAEDKLIRTVTERVKTLSPEQIGILQELFTEPPENFDKALAVWKAMKG